MMYYCYLDTPIGDLLLAGDEQTLSLVGFPKGKMRRDPDPDSRWREAHRLRVHVRLQDGFGDETFG